MEITRDIVIKWLTKERRSQTWLAEKCEVSKQAVSNWLRENNPQPISASAQITIHGLMAEDAAASQAKPPHHIVLEFEDAEYEPIEQAAVASGVSVREWAIDALNTAAESDIETFVLKLQSQDKAG